MPIIRKRMAFVHAFAYRWAMAHEPDYDLIILGGGLAGGLIALAFAAERPDLRLLLLEQGEVIGGNHIWSFFDSDIAAADRWLVEPLITHRWEKGHSVCFPFGVRTMDNPYNSIASPQFAAHVGKTLGDAAWTGVTVIDVAPGRVALADGRALTAQAVIDARGAGDLSALRCGWQKFVGHTLRLDAPHGLDRPVIMDATVQQHDGYRFVYLLPWDERTVFVEDTYYSNAPTLDVPTLDVRIAAYAQAQGWRVEAVTHRETGVLPVVHGGEFDRYWPEGDGVARAGVRAGMFQPMTGYSLPDAVRFAIWVTKQPLEGLGQATRARAKVHWRGGGYYRLLGRMLFGAAKPDQRWRIFDRFYQLPAPLIDRFYAGRSNWGDRLRILCGRPPVPIRAAMHALLNPPA